MSQKTIEITNGPSREELFDSLRLGISTSFSFKTEFKEWKQDVYVKGINHVGRKGKDWLVNFSLMISEVIHFDSKENKRPKFYSTLCDYSTEIRRGKIFIELSA